MLKFSALSQNKRYKELLKRVNNRWFSPHNNIYKEGEIMSIGMSWNLSLEDVALVEEVENKPKIMFDKAFFKAFIMRHRYIQNFNNQIDYKRHFKEDVYFNNNTYSYKDYEQVYRYTILAPFNTQGELPLIEPLTNWGEYRELKKARQHLYTMVDHLLDAPLLINSSDKLKRYLYIEDSPVNFRKL
tara:strand:+ start:196 stop:753 length:558 start_codon:yes stop_codon:yes gene_type:complete